MFIFWDLKKAFDKVPRSAMWAVLKRYGCPPDFFKLVRALLEGMVGRVCQQNCLSDTFPINGGLKQGCVLAPTCFSLYTAAMLNKIPPDTPSVDLCFRMDGSAFNLTRLRARTKTTFCAGRELQYADDNATPVGNSVMHNDYSNPQSDYSQLGNEIENVIREEDLGSIIIKDLKLNKKSIKAEKKAQKLIGYTKRQFKYRDKDTVLQPYRSLKLCSSVVSLSMQRSGFLAATALE
ncbi:uncharacterized protein [Palaemon carinicauda]|uniref:uncharacterized protein n=1 Tax=Palaemon carinicauda TaxID=392227 RepID=UPI0035B5C64C